MLHGRGNVHITYYQMVQSAESLSNDPKPDFGIMGFPFQSPDVNVKLHSSNVRLQVYLIPNVQLQIYNKYDLCSHG